ncbi:MAG: hypothetical protein KDJ14_08370 [Xanthomonadales bacterium]|nr:hypothetical protein [Xanthomonadales bacterium]
MPTVHPAPLPPDSLLHRYGGERGYVDCFVTDLPRTVTHADYVTAFYTTGLFKCERLILRLAARRPSSDSEAAALGAGTADRFAAWSVEARSANQLLLCDFTGRTRSWLMTEALPDASGTRLRFGSAVVKEADAGRGHPRMPRGFGLLLGFHNLYSRLLLSAARRRLLAGR